MGRIFYIIAIVFVMFCLKIEGQNPCQVLKYHVSSYDTDKGLVQNCINQLAIDHSGLLWIGSQGGLMSFDGFTFKSAFSVPTTSRISHIIEGDNRIGIFDEMSNYYEVLENKNDVELCYTEASELPFYLYNDAYKKQHKNNPLNFNYEIQNARMRLPSAKNFVFKPYDSYFKNFPLPKNKNKEFFDIYFMVGNSIFFFEGDRIYHSTDGEVKVSFEFPIPTENKNLRLQNGFYFQSKNKSFYLIKDQLFTIKYVDNLLTFTLHAQFSGMQMLNVRSAAFDEKNNIFFFGSQTEGLYVAKPMVFNTVTLKYDNENEKTNYLPNVFYSQVVSHLGEIKTTNELTYSNGEITKEKNAPYIFTPQLYSEGKFYYRIDQNTNTINEIDLSNKIIGKFEYNFAGVDVRTMIELSRSNLLVVDSKKLYEFQNYKLDTVRQLFDPFSKIKIEYIYKKTNDTIWVVTNSGIYNYALASKNLTRDSASPVVKFRNARKSKLGNIWLGTYGDGYYLYKNNMYYKMPLDPNGYLKFVHAALDDQRGNLWLPTNRGLFMVQEMDLLNSINNPSYDVYFHYFDKNDGFNSNEFNGGCQEPAVVTPDSMFSFSSMNGLVQFYPKLISPILPNNKIYITNIWVDDENETKNLRSINVSNNYKFIKIDFYAPFFGNPYNQRIEYKIDGYFENWQIIENNHTLNLPKLPFGDYKIRMRKKIGFGNENYTENIVSLKVSKPYYLQLWFLVMMALGLLSILTMSFRLYGLYLKRQRKILNELIAKRTSELNITNETLKKANETNETLISILIHDVKSPINFIREITGNLSQNWEQTNDSFKKEFVKSVGLTSTKIGNFISNYLLWVSHKKGRDYKKEYFNLYQVVDEVVAFHTEHLYLYNRKENEIQNSVPKDVRIFSNQDCIDIILRNLVDNAIKYGENGQIILYYESHPDKFVIGCKDYGKGMTQSEIEKIYASDYTLTSIKKDSYKLGYVFMKSLIANIGGILEINSEKGKGTDVRLIFPD